MFRARLILITIVLGMAALLISGCHQSSPIEPNSSPVQAPSTEAEPEKPVLSNALERSCQLAKSDNFGNAGLRVGEKAVDFTLRDIYGTEFGLSQLLTEKPVVMVFGSFT